MIYAAIIGCEIGFWVFLAAGLFARYGLRRPRLGAALLVCVPLVDLALLVLTVVDLRRGGEPSVAHGLAALYLGFSVAFGHRLIRSADVRVAHRVAGGPAPVPAPRWGTAARVRHEWDTYRHALAAGGIAVAVLVVAVLAVGDDGDPSALQGLVPQIGVALAIWLVAGPLAATVLARRGRGR